MAIAETPKEIHASLVDYLGRGILLRGASGSGKSDLALRLVDGGCQLVADDRVRLRRKGVQVFGSPPPELAGLLEVRGIGIFRLNNLDEARIDLVVDLVAATEVERLPAPRHETWFGVEVPIVALAPFAVSTPGALKLAVTGTPVAGALAPPA
jgi:serine kinase of HPr protein (carbohydrate metabolism regulator)